MLVHFKKFCETRFSSCIGYIDFIESARNQQTSGCHKFKTKTKKF